MATINVKDAAGSTVALEKPLAPGSAAAAASRPVALSTEDIARLGIITETAPATDTASSGLNGRLQRIAQRITSLFAFFGTTADAKSTATDTTPITAMQVWKQVSASVQSLVGTGVAVTNLNSSGSNADSASTSVAFSTEGKAILGSITETAPAGDTNSSGLNGRLQRIAQRITSLIALVPASLGQKAKATSFAVTLASDEDLLALQGAVTEAAPASDTASSGLNGRLQRIAQNITTLIAASLKTVGAIAHDAVDSTSPVKGGHKATTSLSALTLVSGADVTDSFAGVDGVQITRPHSNLEDIISGVLANTDGASTAVIAAIGAGIKAYITTVILANTSATAVTVDLRDGAAGSVKATFPVPANTSGVICNLPVPLGFSANTAVCMDGSAAASTVTCTLIGFKSKV
jgi:hypothetical protein